MKRTFEVLPEELDKTLREYLREGYYVSYKFIKNGWFSVGIYLVKEDYYLVTVHK